MILSLFDVSYRRCSMEIRLKRACLQVLRNMLTHNTTLCQDKGMSQSYLNNNGRKLHTYGALTRDQWPNEAFRLCYLALLGRVSPGRRYCSTAVIGTITSTSAANSSWRQQLACNLILFRQLCIRGSRDRHLGEGAYANQVFTESSGRSST